MAMDLPLAQAGPWVAFIGLALLIVRAFVKGDVVSRRTHEDIIDDRDSWREAHRISEAGRGEERDQKKELLEHTRTTTAIIASLPQVKDLEDRS